MGSRTTKELYLQVSGDAGGLQTASKAGRTALLELGGAAIDIQEEVKKAFDGMAAAAAPSAKTIEASYKKTFEAIRQNAREILAQPSQGAALTVLNAGAAQEAAAAAENQAQALRQVATAAATVAARAGEAGAAERVLAVAAAAHAEQAERDAVALRHQADVLGAVRNELTTMGVAQRTSTMVSGQQRAAMQQLSFQMNDVAVGFAAGTPPMVIFAQQSGQVIQALSLMTAETKGFLGFLGGPWGMALTSALVVATPFVAKLFEESEASKQAKKTSEEHKKAIDALAEAEGRAVQSAEEKLRNDFKEIELEREKTIAIRETTQALLEQARANLLAAQQGRSDPSQDQLDPTANSQVESLYQGKVANLEAALGQNAAELAKLTTAAGQAASLYVKSIADANSTPEGRVGRKYTNLQRDAELEAVRTQDWARYARTVKDLNTAREAELKALQESQHRRSNSGAAADATNVAYMSEFLKRELPGVRITSTTGGKHVAHSDHYAGRAIDFVPAGGMGSMTKADVRALFESNGIRIRRNAAGVEQLFGPGDKGHSDHFHVAWEGSSPSPATKFKAEQKAVDDLAESLEKLRLAGAKALDGFEPGEWERQRDAKFADMLGHPANDLKAITDQFEAEQQARLDAFMQEQDREREIREGAIRSAAGLYRDLMTGGVGSIWARFKEQGLEVIAELLAKWTIGKLMPAGGGAGGIIGGLFSLLGGHADGLVPGFAAGMVSPAGLISGPGTGRSDSILAFLEGRGLIRVANGESIMTAEATSQYGPVLKAMNDNQPLPGFAGGLVPDERIFLRGMPAAALVRRESSEHRVSVAIEPSPLFRTAVQQETIRTVGAAAEPIMAGSEARTIRTLRRPMLPGGLTG